MVWTALGVAFLVTLAQHLGLIEAVARIALRIARCAKCSTFWLTGFAVFLLYDDIYAALALSILCAYISNWYGLVLVELNKLYTYLWERIVPK